MPTYEYPNHPFGNVRGQLVSGKLRLSGTPEDEPMEKRVTRALYEMEQQQGSRFNGVGTTVNGRPEYGKSLLKRIWVDRELG